LQLNFVTVVRIRLSVVSEMLEIEEILVWFD